MFSRRLVEPLPSVTAMLYYNVTYWHHRVAKESTDFIPVSSFYINQLEFGGTTILQRANMSGEIVVR